MKQTKHLFLLLLCMIAAAGTFTSCLDSDNDDDYSIDPAQYRQYLSLMSGSYYGKARYYCPKPNSTTLSEKYDSVEYTTWTMRTDSILRCNIDVSMLDTAVVGTSYSELKEAIKNCNQTSAILDSYYWIPTTDYVSTNSISFIVNPFLLTVDLEYGGSTHTVAFLFYQNLYGGSWSVGSLTFSIVLQAIYPNYRSESNLGSAIASDYFQPVGIIFSPQ